MTLYVEKPKHDRRTTDAITKYLSEHPDATMHEAAMAALRRFNLCSKLPSDKTEKNKNNELKKTAIKDAPAMKASDEAQLAAQEQRSERDAIQDEADA